MYKLVKYARSKKSKSLLWILAPYSLSWNVYAVSVKIYQIRGHQVYIMSLFKASIMLWVMECGYDLYHSQCHEICMPP